MALSYCKFCQLDLELLTGGLLMHDRRTFLSWGSMIAGLAMAGRSNATEQFNLVIARKFMSDTCTSGYLAVAGNIIAYTVELPWRGNMPLISSIPMGSYSATLRYDHADHWRIELVGVPKRDHVQIHIGNTTSDIEGCIIIGTKLNPDLCSLTGGSSKVAYDALRTAFYGTASPVSTPNKTINVDIQD